MTKKTYEIDVLDPYQQARVRSEMWLGSRDPHTQEIITYDKNWLPTPSTITWVPALFTAYREVVDNAVDEIVSKGHGSRLDISYNETKMVFKISDDGRGIPISNHPKFDVPEATLALSRAFSGRNFNDDERGGSRGLNGVGAAIVNFCSEWFKLDICRDGKEFSQTFSEGKEALVINEPLITPKTKNKGTGTTIEFKLSKKVFKHTTLPEFFIRDRAIEIALSYPTLKVYFNGEHLKAIKGVERTLFKGHKPIVFEVSEEGFVSKFWLIPNFATGADHSHSVVNGIPMFSGGTHIDSFRRGFYSGLLKALEPMAKKKKLKPNRSDVSDGLLIYNITEMLLPSFDSQSKTRLINETAGKQITAAMDDPDFFKSVVRKNPEWIESVFERCEKRTQKSDASDLAKLARKGKRSKVEKLKDATGKDRSRSVLFLGEGDCLHEDTEVISFDEKGNRQNVKIKNLTVGSLVVGKSNKICRVSATSKKISKTTTLKTKYGDIVMTDAHRMLVHDNTDDTIKWVKCESLDKTIHRLVRNRVADNPSFYEITHNDLIDGYHTIIYQNPDGQREYQICTPTHYYGVFDFNSMTFAKVMAKDIIPNQHALLIEDNTKIGRKI